MWQYIPAYQNIILPCYFYDFAVHNTGVSVAGGIWQFGGFNSNIL